ncbi:MAG: NFACT family protein [Deinococcales bacterium]
MEGLLIAEEVAKIAALLPSARQSWRFPDAYTFVLPLEKGAVWLYNRPPNARIAHERPFPAPTGSFSGFQDLLVAKASGELEQIEQLKLDRVVKLYFGPMKGFVESPPVVLIAEITGRNCNLILTDDKGIILGAARDIREDINRFRQLRAGLPYQGPPPYEKIDPRRASEAELETLMAGKSLAEMHRLIDGIGPTLKRTLSVYLGQREKAPLAGDKLEPFSKGLRKLVAAPSVMIEEVLGLPDVGTLAKAEARDRVVEGLEQSLKRQLDICQKRLDDIDKNRQAAQEADQLRYQASLLMAYHQDLKPHQSQLKLKGFAGEDVTIYLDPKLSLVQNAEALYIKAKKREQRKIQAESHEDEIVADYEKLDNLLNSLETKSDAELKVLADEYLPKTEGQFRALPYSRYLSPQGYSVLVGRNAKGNDHISFKLAKSEDMWLHVQGMPGSHVIIQAQKKPVPFETILYAAELAAAHSKAGQSDNVAVDYTLKKHVWKLKGMPLGAVHFSQQKTVFVTPKRHSALAEG